jgi:phage tail sheath gpL-like
MTITVTGFPASDPIPAIRLNVLLGQGIRSPGTGVRSCIMIGQRGHAEGGAAGGAALGTATDKQIYAVYSAEEAAGYWGRGSNMHRSAIALFSAWRGITLYGVSLARGGAGGGAAGTHGTARSVLAGGVATAGNVTITIGDAEPILVPAIVGEAFAAIGARIETAIDTATDLPVWCTYAAGNIDLFAKSNGAGSTGVKYRFDAGTTSFTFDAAATDSGALAAGTEGTEGAGPSNVWTTACDVIEASDLAFTYVLPTAWTDAVLNVTGGVADMIMDDCTADIGKRMHQVIGHNGAVADALTLADAFDDETTAVDEIGFRTQLVWAAYNEAQPWEISAAVLGMRAEAESSNINSNWIGFSGATIPGSCGLHKCVSSANYPTVANFTSCLNGGVTPIKYDTEDDTLTVVRSVTAKHLTSGLADYRCRDTNVAVVPDFIALGLQAALQDEYDGFTITDDVDGAPPDNLGSYVTTPILIRDSIARLLKTDYELPGYITNCDDNAASLVVERNASNSQRVDAEIPVEVVRHLYQIGGNVREVGA